MTVLALRLASYRNGVSKLHGEVSRRMWQPVWPGVPVEEVPIGHITNGVHFRSWISQEMEQLYDRYLGPQWRDEPSNGDVWNRVHEIPAEELWRTHERRRERLVAWARRRVRNQRVLRSAPQAEIEAADEILDPDALTIGFARRFATYKRANLIFSDPVRLRRLLLDADRPVQLVFSGKAHPADRPGQDVLRTVYEMTLDPELRRRIVFVEDYDINVGRHMVQGVDVWLNNPRRPQEASGTSGQKVLLNGGLNLSVLDGWWAEAYDGLNGFAIGDGTTHVIPAEQDRRDADSLYRTLESEVVPLYYERDEHGVPHGWVARIKRAIRTLGWRFNTDRMVMDYVRECYLPSAGATSCQMPK
jgi:starch phosphorylase